MSFVFVLYHSSISARPVSSIIYVTIVAFCAHDLHLSSFFADMCPLKWNIHAHGRSRHIFFFMFPSHFFISVMGGFENFWSPGMFYWAVFICSWCLLWGTPGWNSFHDHRMFIRVICFLIPWYCLPFLCRCLVRMEPEKPKKDKQLVFLLHLQLPSPKFSRTVRPQTVREMLGQLQWMILLAWLRGLDISISTDLVWLLWAWRVTPCWHSIFLCFLHAGGFIWRDFCTLHYE